MARIRKTRQWGSQIVIPLTAIDCKDLSIQANEEVDIEKIRKVNMKQSEDDSSRTNE